MASEPPLETISPLSRLILITRQISTYSVSNEFRALYSSTNGHYNLGPCVPFFLHRPLSDRPYSTIEMLEDYTSLYKFCNESLDYVERNSPVKAKPVNMSIVYQMVSLYSNANIGTLAVHINNFSSEILDRADMIDQNISDKEEHHSVSQMEIAQISEKINNLISVIAVSGFSSEIKSKLTVTLIAMLDGVTRINFIGPEKMLENIDIFLGQGLQNVGMHGQEPEKQHKAMAILRNGVEIAENAQKVVEASAVLIPVFRLGFDKLLELLPLLPKL